MPSASASGRITKCNPPRGTLRRGNYRERAYENLLEDFDSRCAYSLQHTRRVGSLEIDHFNPTLKNEPKQEYTNLFPATKFCNGRKSNYWPKTQADYDRGMRLLNPRKEKDYGAQILEIHATGELIGANAAARFHIMKLELNDRDLCKERLKRTEYLGTIFQSVNSPSRSASEVKLTTEFQEEVSFMISPPPTRYATAAEILKAAKNEDFTV